VEDMPWLTFSEGQKAPSFPLVFEQNWMSYYKWRGLPLKSPAALLLHWPLSMYRLLYLLGFVPKDPGGPEHRKLTIHWLGIEVRSAILFGTTILTHYQYRLKQISCQCVFFIFIFSFNTHPLDGSFVLKLHSHPSTVVMVLLHVRAHSVHI
jgi:hypothetical protein